MKTTLAIVFLLLLAACTAAPTTTEQTAQASTPPAQLQNPTSPTPVTLQATQLETFDFHPECHYQEIPQEGGWHEDWDSQDVQSYCFREENTSGIKWVYIHQTPLGIGNPSTPDYWKHRGSIDFWHDTNYTQQTGNIREVLISFSYYYPSYNGFCIQNHTESGAYTTPQFLLITNTETNFSIQGNFDAAIYQFNDQIVCDQELFFSHPVKDFENEFGSSFSGQSKEIQRVAFETSMVYIWNVTITGATAEDVW